MIKSTLKLYKCIYQMQIVLMINKKKPEENVEQINNCLYTSTIKYLKKMVKIFFVFITPPLRFNLSGDDYKIAFTAKMYK